MQNTHVHFSVFVNGALSGHLVLRKNEFDEFCLQLEAGGDYELERV